MRNLLRIMTVVFRRRREPQRSTGLGLAFETAEIIRDLDSGIVGWA